MDPAHVFSLKCGMLALPVLGLASAFLARANQGSRFQPALQFLFLLAMVVVGAETIVAIGIGPGCWLASGATLSLMVVAAVWEFDWPVEADL